MERVGVETKWWWRGVVVVGRWRRSGKRKGVEEEEEEIFEVEETRLRLKLRRILKE